MTFYIPNHTNISYFLIIITATDVCMSSREPDYNMVVSNPVIERSENRGEIPCRRSVALSGSFSHTAGEKGLRCSSRARAWNACSISSPESFVSKNLYSFVECGSPNLASIDSCGIPRDPTVSQTAQHFTYIWKHSVSPEYVSFQGSGLSFGYEDSCKTKCDSCLIL